MKKVFTSKSKKRINSSFLTIDEGSTEATLTPKKSTLDFLKRFAHSYYAIPSGQSELIEAIPN